jgi:ethanolamine ammonia-lyase large subunit
MSVTPAPTERPVEMLLAQLQDSSVVAYSDPLVTRFRQDLVRLQTHCTITFAQAADSIVTAQKYLKENAVNESLANILRNWTTSFPSGLDKMTEKHCDEMLGIWMYLRARLAS